MKYSLAFVVDILNKVNTQEVVDIIHEDGSGKKFLYRLRGDLKWHFVDIEVYLENLKNITEIVKRHEDNRI